jgi:hypothetical protein
MIPRPTSLATAQAVLFFGPGTQVHGARVFRALPDELLAQFDGEPVLAAPTQGALQINIPGLAVPTIVLRRRDGNAQLSIGPQRADLVSPTGHLGGTLEAFLSRASETLLTVRTLLDARVPRVAAVVQWYRAIPTPPLALAEQFCRQDLMRQGPLNRPENFELHAHKVFRTGFGMNVNSWVRNRSAVVTATNTPVVSVEQDMNTLDDGTVDLEDGAVSTFFRGIAGELDQALALYYPNEAAGP